MLSDRSAFALARLYKSNDGQCSTEETPRPLPTMLGRAVGNDWTTTRLRISCSNALVCMHTPPHQSNICSLVLLLLLLPAALRRDRQTAKRYEHSLSRCDINGRPIYSARARAERGPSDFPACVCVCSHTAEKFPPKHMRAHARSSSSRERAFAAFSRARKRRYNGGKWRARTQTN